MEVTGEIQDIILQYTENFGAQHFLEHYIYAFFDCSGLSYDRISAVKTFLEGTLKSKDCIGSINQYRDMMDGLLLMDRSIYEGLKSELKGRFDLSNITEL